MQKIKGSVIFIVGLILVGFCAYLFLHGYKDAHELNDDLTYAQQFWTNLQSDNMKVIASLIIGGAGLTVLVSNVKKLISK